MPNAEVVFGKTNTIVEHRTPVYIEFDGEKYSGLLIKNEERTFIRWNHKVPAILRAHANGFISEYEKNTGKEHAVSA